MLLVTVTQRLQERVAATAAAVECGNACLQATYFVSVFPGLLNSHVN